MPEPATTPIEMLRAVLDLEKLEINLFRGVTPTPGWKRVYGGQVVAQALMAAIHTVEGRQPHSLHCYFLLGGDPTIPIIYEVERVRDGRSFATRRVKAIQHGQAIFVMSASFQLPEGGLHHQSVMPAVPMPEDLPDEPELRRLYLGRISPTRQAYWRRERPIEMRPVDHEAYFIRRPSEPVQNVWFRANGPLPDDPGVHACVLAYASDATLLDGTMLAHGKSVADPDIQPASLDHAIWFHEDIRADEWLLYAQDSPWAGHARGIGRGLIYNRAGRLVASTMQEGLVRQRKPDTPVF